MSDQNERPDVDGAPPRKKRPYQPPRIVSEDAFEQLALACSSKKGSHKNFT